MDKTSVTIKENDQQGAILEGASQLGVAPEEVIVEALGEGRFAVSLKNAPGTYKITLQPDQMAAYLDLTPPLGTGVAVSPEDILDDLSVHKVTFGVKDELIHEVTAKVAETGQPVYEVCIASGKAPQAGKDGKLELKIGAKSLNKNPEAAVMVKPGFVLAQIIPAVQGSVGKNILGDEISPPEAKDVPFTAGANVEIGEDGVSFAATIYGRAIPSRESILVANPVGISEDKMSAQMDFYPVLADNSRLSMDDVLTSLKGAGVVFGVKEEVIRGFLEQEEVHLKVVVAEGTPAQDGHDAKMEFGFSLNHMDPEAFNVRMQAEQIAPELIVKTLVVAGDVVAKKIMPQDPVDGSTVTGELLTGAQPVDKSISAGNNVVVLDDNLTYVVADEVIAGYANYVDGSVFITDCISVAADNMEVYLTAHPPSEKGKSLTQEFVNKFLRHRGITHGVSQKAIRLVLERALSMKKPVNNAVIARGISPVKGQDGRIDFMINFEQLAGARIQSTERIDFRERSFFHDVKTGDILAHKYPALPGIDGQDVYGNLVPSCPGEEKSLIPTGGVAVSSDGVIFSAEIDGVVTFVPPDKLGVFNEYEIKGDVDYSTGNLAMEGILHIKGWIKPGFKVKASADILVGQGIEGAQVESGANIIIKGGILGAGSTKVKALGDINVSFIERAYVVAEGNINVHNEILLSKVFAGNTLTVLTGKGKMKGGIVSARRGVEAKEVGSRAGIKTIIMVASDIAALRRLTVLKKQIKDYRRDRAKLNTLLARLAGSRKTISLLKDARRKQAIMIKKRRDLGLVEAKLASAQKILKDELSKTDAKNVKIVIKNNTYAGTTVIISDQIFKVNEDINKPTTFALNEKGQIAIQ